MSLTPQQNGLARFRERQRLEKEVRMAEIAVHRADATTELRDGREWTVVHLPDGYVFETTLRVKINGRTVPRP